MIQLTQAHRELFRRSPDETFDSFESLVQHCRQQRERSADHWYRPLEILPHGNDARLELKLPNSEAFRLNDWSFTQLCTMARVKKETLNRLSPKTAGQVFCETLPSGDKPLQLLTTDKTVRSIHGASYTRLWNTELLAVLQEFGTDFRPPQQADAGGTGLYAGEQDMFCFLIDPGGWAEIGGEAFAPGLFCWNSEVGKRSVGMATFWFQAVCANHIVWDATEVREFSRKHTANVHDALSQIRQTVKLLVAQRNRRKDGFVEVVRKAMQTKLGDTADDALKTLQENGIQKKLAEQALEIAREKGAFTIFALVDALTRLSGQVMYAGDRMELDQKAASLLCLVAAA